jgi:ATP-dependent helicase HrpB
MKQDPNLDLAGSNNGWTLTGGLLHLILDLIVHCHEKEPIDGVFVIFAPTYRHLEQIYEILRYESPVDNWKVGVLHSSVDMDYCLRSMTPDTEEGSGVARRKILVANAIADSSVTIPGVTCVVDLCRSLEVKLSAEDKTHIPRTVWSSHSICDQRRGRTGRTCAGKVFRLVPKGFYVSKMEKWETPQLCHSSCRDELLKILCTPSVRNPNALLEQCLDAPPPAVVHDALQYLKSIGACSEGRKRILPTKSGELMAMLPFQVEDTLSFYQAEGLG